MILFRAFYKLIKKIFNTVEAMSTVTTVGCNSNKWFKYEEYQNSMYKLPRNA